MITYRIPDEKVIKKVTKKFIDILNKQIESKQGLTEIEITQIMYKTLKQNVLSMYLNKKEE